MLSCRLIAGEGWLMAWRGCRWGIYLITCTCKSVAVEVILVWMC